MTALRIRVFGGLSVESHGTQLAPAARQPKRLALLAIIACAGSQGVTRDHLMAYLWPESDEARSRNALNQALFGIRRDLLNDELIEGREILRLNPAAVTSDVADFESALSAGRPEEAVELYRGPLLMGVHLREGREFGEWLERERTTFLQRYRGALQNMISRSRRLGDLTTSVRRARELVESDPYDAAAVRELLEVLLACGDRPGAVRAAQSYGRRIRRELGLDPDPSVLAHLSLLVARLPNDIPPPTEPSVVNERTTEHHLVSGAAVAIAHVQRSKPMARLGRRLLITIVGASGLVLATLGVATVRRRTPPTADQQGTSIVVLPFAVRGSSVEGYLADGMARLVAYGLDGVGPVRAGVYAGADSLVQGARDDADTANLLTRRFRLDRYITGEVIAIGDRIEVRAILHDGSHVGRVLGTASARGVQDSVFALAESISRQLLGAEPTEGGGAMIRGASNATTSLAAFQAFVEGEVDFRASRFADAVAAFQRAIKHDSTFALAYYRLTVVADWNAQGELIPAAAKTALRLANRLAWRERMLLEGSVAWREGHNGIAEARLREITTRYPNDAESWFQLAEVLFHSNQIRGRSFLESRVPFERVATLDPTNRGALSHLARIHAYLGDARRADSLLSQAEALMAPNSDPELRMFHATVRGDATAREAAITRLALEPAWVGQAAASRIASYVQDAELADSILRRVALSGVGNADANFILLHVMLATAQGQFARALEQASALAESLPTSSLEVQALLLSLQGAPYTAEDRSNIVRQVHRSLSRAPSHTDKSWSVQVRLERPVRTYLLGLLAARDGDTTRLRRYSEAVDAVNLPGARGDVVRSLAAGLRGHLLALEGDPAGALRELSKAPDPGDQPMQAQLLVNQLPERLLRATLLAQVGRDDEALAVYQSLIFGGGTELLFVAPAALHRARLLARLGRFDAARLDYETFLHTWKEADVGVRPIADSARRELAGLPVPPRRP